MSALLALTALLLGGPADFDPQSEDWNGMRYVATTAAEAKVELEVVPEFDWRDVDSDDVLVFLRPGVTVEADELREFVLDGGHAVVALDRGDGPHLLEAFGLRLLTEPVIHSEYYRDHPAFPRLTAPETEAGEQPHFLWYNVAEIILNHPTAIALDKTARGRGDANVLIEFAEPDQAFAVEVADGDGYVLFIGDASIFINDMQRHAYGDKQFAANTLRYFCDDPCSVKVLTPDAVVRGRYSPTGGRALGGLSRQFSLAIAALNETLAAAGDWFGRPEVLFGASASLLLAMLLGSSLLPWPTALPRFAWLHTATHRRSATDYRVQALSMARSRSDFTIAALMLADRFERLAGDRRMDSPAALRCVDTFNKVRARGAGPRPEMRMSAHQFEQLWNDCEAVLGTIT